MPSRRAHSIAQIRCSLFNPNGLPPSRPSNSSAALCSRSQRNASRSLQGWIIRASTSATAIRASRSLMPRPRSTSRKPSCSSADSDRRSQPEERTCSCARLSRRTAATAPDSPAVGSRLRSCSRRPIPSASANSSGSGSNRNVSLASTCFTSNVNSRHRSGETPKSAPRLSSVTCRTRSPIRSLRTRRQVV